MPAVRRRGRRILIHYKDLEAYAERFRLGHTEPVAGPHALRKGENVCREGSKTASTKGKTRRTGGRPIQTDAASELGGLLGFK
ncbi:hypothetical protein [Halomonas elongata]|uniref:hypothetical protein n=1 Tax=Halomonas elongata TaxID=2746 RepID=UPI00384E2222